MPYTRTRCPGPLTADHVRGWLAKCERNLAQTRAAGQTWWVELYQRKKTQLLLILGRVRAGGGR